MSCKKLFDIEQDMLSFINTIDTLDLNEIASTYNRLICDVLYNNQLTENLKRFMCYTLYRFIFLINETTSSNETVYKMLFVLTNCNEANFFGCPCPYDNQILFYKPFLKQMAREGLQNVININMIKNPKECWKGIKQLCDMLFYNEADLVLFNHTIEVIVNQLLLDNMNMLLDCKISTLSEWLPKERCKTFGYLTRYISGKLNEMWDVSSENNYTSPKKINNRNLMYYRKFINQLKRKLYIDEPSINLIPLFSPDNNKPYSFYESNNIICHATKYSSYNQLLDSIHKTNILIKNQEEFIDLWENILYGDIPNLIGDLDIPTKDKVKAEVKEEEVKEEVKEEVEEEVKDEVKEEATEEYTEDEDITEDETDDEFTILQNQRLPQQKGWFSWFSSLL